MQDVWGWELVPRREEETRRGPHAGGGDGLGIFWGLGGNKLAGECGCFVDF